MSLVKVSTSRSSRLEVIVPDQYFRSGPFLEKSDKLGQNSQSGPRVEGILPDRSLVSTRSKTPGRSKAQ